MPTSITATERTQRGAALIVGLVLLMVLTVLAISVMRTATLDLSMAGNAQFRENAFQLAESGLATTMRGIATGAISLDTVPDCPAEDVPRPWSEADLVWLPEVGVPALRGRYQVRVCYEDSTEGQLGQSFASTAGSGTGTSFMQLHYRIESRGRTDQRNAEAIHAQGFYRSVEQGL